MTQRRSPQGIVDIFKAVRHGAARLRPAAPIFALAALMALGGCSVIVDSELSNKTAPITDGGVDAGPTGETCTTDGQCVTFDPFNCHMRCIEGHCQDRTDASENTLDGTPCSQTPVRNLCVGGECVTRECGDGFLDRGGLNPEYCDDGNQTDGDGCDHTCTRPCGTGARTCNDFNVCNGVERCSMADVCEVALRPDDGSACMTADAMDIDGTCEDQICVANEE